MVMMPSTYQPSHSPKASPLSLVNITSSPPPMITPFNFVSTDTQACSCIIHTYHFSCIHTYIIHDAYVFVYTYIYQIKENIDHFTIIYMHRLRVQVLRPLQQWLLQCQNQATIGLHSRHRRRLLCTYQDSS